MIQQILTYMRNIKGRVIRVSTTRESGEPYETMVFENDSFRPVGAYGGYCERGSLATPLHLAAVNRYWGRGFRTLKTVSSVK